MCHEDVQITLRESTCSIHGLEGWGGGGGRTSLDMLVKRNVLPAAGICTPDFPAHHRSTILTVLSLLCLLRVQLAACVDPVVYL